PGDHRGTVAGSGRRRRRHRRPVSGGRGHGAGCRRRPRQHRHRHRRRPRRHGRRLQAGGRGGAHGVPGRAPGGRRGGRRLLPADRLPVVTSIELESRPVGIPDGTAAADLLRADVGQLREVVERAGSADVERVLRARRRTLADFGVLLSPAAADRLEDMARIARSTTIRRFGRTVRLFAPLYLSNECVSTCTYCGFSAGNRIARRTLTPAELLNEARALRARGFRHLLLVSGEHARIVSKDYLVEYVRQLAPETPSISVEVQVWDTGTYRRLVEAGCEGLVVYQETYDRETYGAVHIKGKKR